jgi:hypothetical protein
MTYAAEEYALRQRQVMIDHIVKKYRSHAIWDIAVRCNEACGVSNITGHQVWGAMARIDNATRQVQ